MKLIILILFTIFFQFNFVYGFYLESCIDKIEGNYVKDINDCGNIIIGKIDTDVNIIGKPFYTTYFNTENNYQFRLDNELKLVQINGGIMNNFANISYTNSSENISKKGDVIIFNSKFGLKNLKNKEKLDHYLKNSKEIGEKREDLEFFQKKYQYIDILNNTVKSKFPKGFSVISCKDDKIIIKNNIFNYNIGLPFSENEYKKRLENKNFKSENNGKNILRKSLLIKPRSLKDNYNLGDLENDLQFLAPCVKFNKTFGVLDGGEKIQINKTTQIKENNIVIPWYINILNIFLDFIKNIFS